MDTVPTSVIECALLDGAPPQLGDGGAWCDAHNKCDHCAQDVVDAARDELRRLKAERDRALAELDKALGEREESDGWVRLPVDADGETIHIGDVMEWCDSGETLTVEGIGSDALFYIDGGNAEWTAARNKRHHVPTVEDVLQEFADQYAFYKEVEKGIHPDLESHKEVLRRFAARLRLADE